VTQEALASFPERSAAIRRATALLCLRLGWAPMHEMSLPNNRRADIMALRPDGGFVCIEIKSGVRDFLTDAKWPEYREYCDALFFAVDTDFPQALLPDTAGLVVTWELSGEMLRDAPLHPMPPARRRALTLRFAHLAALRLAQQSDLVGVAALRSSLRSE